MGRGEVADGDGPTEQNPIVDGSLDVPGDATAEVPRPAINSLVLAAWALFLGLALMLAGAGLFGTLIAVRTELDGFSSLAIRLVTAAYRGGFVAGARIPLRSLGSVGHFRVYAALASLLAAQYSSSIFAKPWNAVPVAGRVFYLPATAVAMGRRLRPIRRRRRPPTSDD